MTTIVYRDGILAADSRAYSGHSAPVGFKRKIYGRERDGAMIGVSSTCPGLSEQIAAWFLDDKNPDREPSWPGDAGFDAIEIDAEGDVFFYGGTLHPTGPLSAPYFAIGSGAEYALGAMLMGANAMEAVQAGITFDPWSAGDMTVIEHSTLHQGNGDDDEKNELPEAA